MSECGCQLEAKNAAQRKALFFLLIINGAMFALEIATGILAQSTALVADALDMLADAAVYGISLYAIGRPVVYKNRAATFSGIVQITLACGVLLDAIQKFTSRSEPEPTFIVGIGLVALVANVACLWLLSKHRKGEVHMRASWIFSKNDVLANVGVIVAGLLVALTQSQWPDLIAGFAIALLVLSGGVQILQEVRRPKMR